jgi:hypothetical protein
VWAIDFSEPLHPIDGVYEYLFAVRDLGSHCQLAWHPFRGEAAAEAIQTLEELFRRWGPPLVLKSDNGSAFIAEAFRDRLVAWGVSQLFSPARHPQYNGALERSNGTLKTYTHQQAITAGHPFRWTSEDVERARQLANTISRPWGHSRATPEEAWQSRDAIGPQERLVFLQAVALERSVARVDLGLDLMAELTRVDAARVDRLALSRALVNLEYLEMRRVVRAPKKAKRPSRAERQKMLATSPGNATMRRGAGDAVIPPTPSPPESAHGERPHTSWLRRSIALIVRFAKVAKITWV